MATKTAKKVTGTKFTPRQLTVLAALFAHSNLGLDLPTRERVQSLLNPKANARDLSLGAACLYFSESYMESDEHYDMFVEEAKSWLKDLKDSTFEKEASYHPDIIIGLFADAQPKFWKGTLISKIDNFGRPIANVFIDGVTKPGPQTGGRAGVWAIMSAESFKLHGVGLGQGLGQRYTRVRWSGGEHRWLKVEG